MKFYVGNLNFRITEDQLRALFEPYGPVEDLIILTDRETGRSRGFGFITLTDDDKAKQAYAELNQKDFEGRTLVMNEARPRTDGPQGAGQGGGHSGGHSSGGGGYSGGGNSSAPGYSRSTGGGYSNQTYASPNADSPSNAGGSPQDTSSQESDSGYAGDNLENNSGGNSGGGGYSRGGNH